MLSFTLAFMHSSIHQVLQASTHTGVCLYSACNTHIYVSYLIMHTLFASFTHACLPQCLFLVDSCTVHAKHSKHVQLKKIKSQLLVMANSETHQA